MLAPERGLTHTVCVGLCVDLSRQRNSGKLALTATRCGCLPLAPLAGRVLWRTASAAELLAFGRQAGPGGSAKSLRIVGLALETEDYGWLVEGGAVAKRVAAAGGAHLAARDVEGGAGAVIAALGASSSDGEDGSAPFVVYTANASSAATAACATEAGRLATKSGALEVISISAAVEAQRMARGGRGTLLVCGADEAIMDTLLATAEAAGVADLSALYVQERASGGESERRSLLEAPPAPAGGATCAKGSLCYTQVYFFMGLVIGVVMLIILAFGLCCMGAIRVPNTWETPKQE